MFKKIVSLILFASCVASLAACSKANVNSNSTNDINGTESSITDELNNIDNSDSLVDDDNTDSGNSSNSGKRIEATFDGKLLDPFEGVEITYTGTAPYITASVNTIKCTDEVNENVKYVLDKETNLRNGDEISVTAVLNRGYYYDQGKEVVYELTEKTKTFKVENQPEYVNSLDGLDITNLQNELNDKLAVKTAANVDDSYFAGVFIVNNYGYFQSIESKSIKSKYLMVKKKQYENDSNTIYNDSDTIYNRYIEVYDYLINGSKSKPAHIYVMVCADDIATDVSGTLSWDTLDSSANDNYDSLINDEITKNREYYNIIEIK